MYYKYLITINFFYMLGRIIKEQKKVSFTDVNEHTKKVMAEKQYKNMGKIAVTTPDRTNSSIEKSFALEGKGSLLAAEKTVKSSKNATFAGEFAELKNNPKNRITKPSAQKQELKLPEIAEGEKTELLNVPVINNEAMQVINALMHTQNSIVQELTDVFDRRLEKFDDIIMDLIRCKTENERLKQKVDNLTRDNYKYKKEVESYKSVVPGLYIKKEADKTRF